MQEGGGSFEDLFGFNDEALAYAIFESKIPIVSAVGHETDFTICDFVSDLRAPTPSAAAELVYPSEVEIKSKLESLNIRMNTAILNKLERNKQYLNTITKGRLEKTPVDLVNKYTMMIANYIKNIQTSINFKYTKCRNAFEKQVALLDSFSPLKTMSRGYVVATDNMGKLVSKIGDVKSR